MLLDFLQTLNLEEEVHPIFLEAGVEDMYTLECIGEQDLGQITGLKFGHRMKIIKGLAD